MHRSELTQTPGRVSEQCENGQFLGRRRLRAGDGASRAQLRGVYEVGPAHHDLGYLDQ